MNQVQELHRRIQSGKLKTELRTASEAVLAARMVYQQIAGAGIYVMTPEQEGFHVHIAFLTPDLASLGIVEFVRGKEADIQAELARDGRIMAGVIFSLWDDAEEHKNWIIGTRQFISTERVDRLFDSWMITMFLSNAPTNA